MQEIVGAEFSSYSPEDQAFFRFWYAHMKDDLMQPPLANVRHGVARYIWDAAMLATAAAVPVGEVKPVGQLCEAQFGRGAVFWFNKPADGSMLYTTPPAPIEGWRPIETAPKDHGSTMFDVWANGERHPNCWWGKATYEKGESGIVYQSDYDCNGPVDSYVRNATHWMPLPAAPQPGDNP